MKDSRFSVFLSSLLNRLTMSSRNDLNLEQKINLIRENERGMSYRELKDKSRVLIFTVSNI